jgi:hypothetical protein
VEKGKDEDIPESQSKKRTGNQILERPSRECKKVNGATPKPSQRKVKPPRKTKPVGEFSQEEMEKVPSDYEMRRHINVIAKKRELINKALDPQWTSKS